MLRNKTELLFKYAFWLVLLTILLFIFVTYKDYGISWDEQQYFIVGKYYAAKILDFLSISHNLQVEDLASNQIIPEHFLAHGVIFDVLTVFATLIFKNSSWEIIHLIRALMAFPIFLIVGYLGNLLWGRPWGLVGIILLFIFPLFWGHLFFNPVDIPTTLIFSLYMYTLLLVGLKRERTTRHLTLLGLTLGLTVSQRFGLVYLIPITVLLLWLTREVNLSIKKFIYQTAAVLVVSLLLMHITHPYLLSHPIGGLYDMFQTSRQYVAYNEPVLFGGKFILPYALSRLYLPTMMLLTIPLMTIILFFFGLLRLFAQWHLAWARILIVLFLTPLIIVVSLHPVLYDSWRHFLFLTPVIALVATYGLRAVWKVITEPAINRVLLVGLIGIIMFNFFLTAREMILLHPYEYIYYNSLAGGLKGAYGKYETDYWGLSYKEAVAWFNENINQPQSAFTVATEGNPLSSVYYLENNIRHKFGPVGADYFIAFTRWNRHERNLGPVVHIIERKGIPLVFIRKVIDDYDAINQ